MGHIHPVTDGDNKYFIIDPVTRTIANKTAKRVLIKNDHNSERFTFELPLVIEGHDMSTCNRIEVHYINISGINVSNRSLGVYEVHDAEVIEIEGESKLVFTWLISGNVTMYAGSVNFAIRFACVTDTVDYSWNTAIFSNLIVSDGIYNSETVFQPYADILQQWWDALENSSVYAITEDSELLPLQNLVDIMNDELVDINTDKLDKTGDSKDNFITFSEAETRDNIESGETHSITFGKIKKHFSDLGGLAYRNSVGDSDISVLEPLSANKIDIMSIFNTLYPVGSIYITTSGTNPGSHLGGGWAPWGSGRVPVGVDISDGDFNTPNKIGGEKTNSLTIAEMPSHSHELFYCGDGETVEEAGIGSVNHNSGETIAVAVETTAKGRGLPHNNVQPYITCFMWKRIALYSEDASGDGETGGEPGGGSGPGVDVNENLHG